VNTLDELGFWPRALLAALACWRLTHLIAHEDGPFNLVLALRQRVGNGPLGQWMDCPYCVSVWVAMPLAPLLCHDLAGWGLAVLALSGAASLVERFAPPAGLP
jgi:hypothetical protein